MVQPLWEMDTHKTAYTVAMWPSVLGWMVSHQNSRLYEHVNVDLLWYQVFTDMIKLRWSHTKLGWVLIQQMHPYKETEIHRRKKAVWSQRHRLEWHSNKPRNDKDRQQPPETGDRWGTDLPQNLQNKSTRPRGWFLNLQLLNCENRFLWSLSVCCNMLQQC